VGGGRKLLDKRFGGRSQENEGSSFAKIGFAPWTATQIHLVRTRDAKDVMRKVDVMGAERGFLLRLSKKKACHYGGGKSLNREKRQNDPSRPAERKRSCRFRQAESE